MAFENLEEIYATVKDREGDKIINGLQLIKEKKSRNLRFVVRVSGMPLEVILNKEEAKKMKNALQIHY